MQLIGIESYVVMLNEVVRQQMYEAYEEVGGTLTILMMVYAMLHHTAQVKQEDGVERAKAFFQEAMSRVKIAHYLAHAVIHVICLRCGEAYYRLSKL